MQWNGNVINVSVTYLTHRVKCVNNAIFTLICEVCVWNVHVDLVFSYVTTINSLLDIELYSMNGESNKGLLGTKEDPKF